MNNKKIRKHIHFITVKKWHLAALLSGLAVAFLSFTPNLFIQSLSLLVVAPLFLSVLNQPKKQAYTAGLIFFSAWILPTTYWYYGFMPWWLAALASIGYVTLIANLFHLMNIKNRIVALILICLAWALFTYIRIRLPVVEDWWLPHLGYTGWSNPALLWFGKYWGEAGVESVVLLSNAIVAILLWRRRYILSASIGITLYVGFILAGLFIASQPSASPLTVLALQRSVIGGVDAAATSADVDGLMQATVRALADINESTSSTIAVWPENKIPVEEQGNISEFAKQNGIAVAYHTVESIQDDKTLKKVNIVDSQGEVVLTNYKLHIAPGEIAVGKYSTDSEFIHDRVVSAYVCYDLHYPDATARMQGASLVVVPLNDAAFGRLQKTFHSADITLRAIQANTDVAVSSTTGPTMYVTRKGVVKSILTYDQNGSLVIQ